MRRLTALFPIILLLPMMSCTAAPSTAAANGRVVDYTSCGLPKDQNVGSLHGQWSSLPVPLLLDQDFYVADSGAVVQPLRNAVLSWNTWAALRSFTGAFSLKNDGTGVSAGYPIPDETSSCVQAAYSTALPDAVGVWKITGYGAHVNRRASCPNTSNGQPGKILANGVQGQTDWIIQSGKIIGASVLLNFEDYNAPGMPHIDVESLLLHELGHVLGLLHSCNGSSGSSTDTTTAPACFTGGVLSAPTQYVNAVMFPFLETDQLRRHLQQNDYSRINCLY